ncbi:MAG TPA: CHASE3 domain-containing protein, partial [Gemmataceae bacterium]|nr:CHASE3 domain-containing protein [Gemmataceae bacterium]
MSLSVGKIAGIGLGLVLLLLGAVGGFSYWDTEQLQETARWVAHTHEVLGQIEGLRSALLDAEAGVRGYVLTGEESYL